MKEAPYTAVVTDIREGQTVINKAKDADWVTALSPWIVTEDDLPDLDFDTCDYIVLFDPPPLPTWVPDNLLQPLKDAVDNGDTQGIIDAGTAIAEAL